MDITVISDTHGFSPKLPGGDLLIVAGDLTEIDDDDGYAAFELWLCHQNYKKKIIIAGNHDNQLQNKKWAFALDHVSEYLCDSGTEFEYEYEIPSPKGMEGLDVAHSEKKTLKIYGSPWTKTFPGMNASCKAFTVDTEEELAEKWDLIPDDTDILITHCPPYGIFDAVGRQGKDRKGTENTGSNSLRNQAIGRIMPKLHVFGHIHEWGGKMVDLSTTIFVNASHVDENYRPVNKPVRIELQGC